MEKLQTRIESYKDWQILIDLTCYGYVFHVCPTGDEPLTNGLPYRYPDKAQRKAWKLVDRLISREQIEELLEGWLASGKISLADYQQLDRLLQELFLGEGP